MLRMPEHARACGLPGESQRLRERRPAKAALLAVCAARLIPRESTATLSKQPRACSCLSR